MLNQMPSYYRKSRVMHEVMTALENECKRLSDRVTLTENQFFVLLSDENIAEHERDVGLTPDVSAGLDTRRGRILSKLRGTGAVTKSQMKNVAASFVNGDIEIIEYPSRYCFAVKFTSKQGVPYNLTDIQNMIEEIKPAHLAVEYIFTYRLWEDIRTALADWSAVRTYTWDGLLTFEVKQNINIVSDVPYYCPEKGNGIVVWNENRAYARRNE